MATAKKYNKSSPGVRRILKEAQEIATSPSRDFTAHPLDHDLFEWHFTLRGPPAPSPFDGGFYHGRILLSPNYPMRPPMFRFLTPSGRFEVNRDICLSISGFHEETWQPSWSIRLALIALRAHMDADPQGQVGGLACTDETRKDLAAKSRDFRCSECGGGGEEEEMKIPEDGEGGSSEPEVPPELRFGYKDEMKSSKEDAQKKEGEEEGITTSPPPPPPSSIVPPEQSVARPSSEEALVPPQQPQQQQQQATAQQRPPAQQEDQQEPAMFIPFGPGQQQPQQQALARGPGNIPAPVIAGAVPMQLANATNEDRTTGYLDLAIGALLAILIALVIKKM
ncbi:hypothetical protein TWF102_006425 [Orbilia oligospora]|uniref:UBC core domain-containing protein n=2 Tax=Orbilia oligospora TaxID=2813651 RepID=A0A7C8J650_ORBOL|nr:hypothetical protein TWF102_006425 [Orbilia oligospora]KAF3106646.1 hypothetical protein TWF706_003170 [Orbilia oligospora]KAF3109715.1 hypothetical protein TWF103_005077 [Orbilia oligospora]KAF3151078.1 hypothetical protein TWF594_008287 [Orbilia oligospora]